MKSGKSKLLYVSICINISLLMLIIWYLFIHVGTGKYYHKYIAPKEAFLDDVYYIAKVNAYADLNKKIPPEKISNVFVGDSLIEQFLVSELFPGKSVLNRGIGQDTTVGILRRLDQNINNVKIASVFLMIGHNDLQYRTIDETCSNIEKILANIRAEKKYFLSIPPCTDAKYDAAIKRVNKKIYKASLEKNFIYLDCYHLFLEPDGSISTQFYYDKTHLNVAGYDKLAKMIEQATKL